MPSSAPQNGPPTTKENGTAASAMAMARARVARVVHRPMYQVMPGANPASATPSRKRTARKPPGVCTRDMSTPAIPQPVTATSSQSRMPRRLSSAACGYWNNR
jgi:hypothetical protein